MMVSTALPENLESVEKGNYDNMQLQDQNFKRQANITQPVLNYVLAVHLK